MGRPGFHRRGRIRRAAWPQTGALASLAVAGAGYQGAVEAYVTGNHLAADRCTALAEELASYAGPEEALAACEGRMVEMFMPELVDDPEPALSNPPWLDGLIAAHLGQGRS